MMDRAQMAAGPEMNAEVARYVFDRQIERVSTANLSMLVQRNADGSGDLIPPYSSSIEWAMTLLDSWHGDWKIRRQNDHYKVTLYEPSMQGNEWAETLPLAICRIRLRAAHWPLAPRGAALSAVSSEREAQP